MHYGVVHYGLDPKNLNETAKSPIRLNSDHQWTTFRVRLDKLRPGTTYYYAVASMEATGTDDGTKSPVKQFTTPVNRAKLRKMPRAVHEAGGPLQ